MQIPSHSLENTLHAQGYRLIAGLDEAGRGAWAGPLVAAAVILSPEWTHEKIRDSKLMTSKSREKLYEEIVAHAVAWSVGNANVEEIDRHGLGWANRTAMERAVEALTISADFLLIDGALRCAASVPLRTIVDGDATVFVIAAASIIAKVTRDRIMRQLHETYPIYGFDRHVGYGTKEHQAALAQHGASPLHRRTFKPIRTLLAGSGILKSS